MLHALMACHQIPSPAVIMRALGEFYVWRLIDAIPTLGRIVCHV